MRDQTDASATTPRPSRRLRLRQALRRPATRRLAALAFGLLLLVLFELACRALNVGNPDLQDDPFVGFSELQPTFVADADGSTYRVSPSRLKFFAPESFPARKPEGARRIFCLGGSTVQGRPFSIPTSLTTWLEIGLNAIDPSTHWDVVNCGGISYASYRLVPLMQECLTHEPDLFIVCTGHNEFLEDRTYSDIRDGSPLLSVPHRLLSRLHSYHVYRQLLLGSSRSHRPSPENILKSDVDAYLDYHNGLAAYHRDREWQRGVVEHFGRNLRRLTALAAQADVPLLFVLPTSNLADQPPFKSQHGDGVSPAEAEEIARLMQRSLSLIRDSPSLALECLERARSIDPELAELRYHIGRMYESQGRLEEARREFVAARDEDICPLRMISALEDMMRDVSTDTDTPLLDAHSLLESRSRDGILGGGLLVDHVHPSIEGHQQIALVLIERLAELGHVPLPKDWRDTVAAAFSRHFDSLSAFYFADGQRTLERVRFWTRGEADGPEWPAAHKRESEPLTREASASDSR